MEIDFVCESTIESIINNSNKNAENHSRDIEEEDENPLNEHRLPCQETIFVPNIPHEHIDNGNIVIAPGQDQSPISIICDEHCEAFPAGQFGYKAERTSPLSPTKYFNQRLLN